MTIGFRAGTQRLHFRMGHGGGEKLPFVLSEGQHFPAFYKHGSHRNILVSSRFAGLFQGQAHESKVVCFRISHGQLI